MNGRLFGEGDNFCELLSWSGFTVIYPTAIQNELRSARRSREHGINETQRPSFVTNEQGFRVRTAVLQNLLTADHSINQNVRVLETPSAKLRNQNPNKMIFLVWN